jgi:RNA polymerase sigma factor (sigma-70 family)
MRTPLRLGRLGDEQLAALVGRGDAAAFETLYDRHQPALLAFCRHMLGNREDGEDALQQAFTRAHRALVGGRKPDKVRPWLFAIARNRCLTMLAARRDVAVPADDVEPSFDGLADDVERRADLRELVNDLSRLPDDQRAALVLAELGDFSHPEIAGVVGCPPAKVKALVFQARTTLIADRDARRTPCDEIRTVLETARAGVLRRGALRRHLRQCDPCAAYRLAVEGRRSGLALVLPVAPTAGLKAAVLAGAGGLGGGAETAAAAAALGAASGGTVAGGAAAAGGVAVKTLAAKAALAVAIGAGTGAGGAAVHDVVREDPVRPAKAASVATGGPAASPGAPEAAPRQRVGDASAARASIPIARPRQSAGDAPAAVRTRDRPRLRRIVPRRFRRAVIRRLRAADPAAAHRLRRRIRRHRIRAGTAFRRHRARARAENLPTIGAARREQDGAVVPAPTATPEPTSTPEPTAPPEPRPRRRVRPAATPIPAPAPTEATAPAAAPATEPTATPTPAP